MRGHWARYPRRKDGSRRPGYRWVSASRGKRVLDEDESATVSQEMARRHADRKEGKDNE